MKVQIEYFAQLRDLARCGREEIEGDFKTLDDVYRDCARRHGFDIDRAHLRVAKNAQFAEWNDTLTEGDRIVFIPPVTGG